MIVLLVVLVLFNIFSCPRAFDCNVNISTPQNNRTYHPISLKANIDVAFGQGPISDIVRHSPHSFDVCIQWDLINIASCIPIVGSGDILYPNFPNDGSIIDGWHTFRVTIVRRDNSISVFEVQVRYAVSTSADGLSFEHHNSDYDSDCSLSFQEPNLIRTLRNGHNAAFLNSDVLPHVPLVALLLIGQIRSFDQTSALLAARLSLPNDADVFSVVSDEAGDTIDNVKRMLMESFGSQKVKAVSFMSHLNCGFDSWERREFIRCFHHLTATGSHASFVPADMFARRSFQFKQYQAGLNLILTYEIESGRFYDALIKSRYDFVPTAPINISRRLFVDASIFSVLRKVAVSIATRVLPSKIDGALVYALGSMAALMFGKNIF